MCIDVRTHAYGFNGIASIKKTENQNQREDTFCRMTNTSIRDIIKNQ